MLQFVLDWVLHLDTHLATLAASHGVLVYTVLFLVIFVETGVIVMPFLPGDSLLFVTGALAAQGILHWPVVVLLLIVAAVTGDAVNFAVGGFLRRKAIDTHRIPFLKDAHLRRTSAFFDKHGKTVTMARFLPIFRTFAPFVAGVAPPFTQRPHRALPNQALDGLRPIRLRIPEKI